MNSTSKAEDYDSILYLSDKQVVEAGLAPQQIVDSLEEIYRARAAGKTFSKPKITLSIGEGRMRFALAAASETPPFASMKCGSLTPDNYRRNLPHWNGLVLLFDNVAGLPVAVMDGKWITAIRAAAVGGVAARRLARVDSSRVGFIGCGVQARSNFAVLRELFPIKEVFAYGEPEGSAEAFVTEISSPAIIAKAVRDPRMAVEQSDIVITSVPQTDNLKPFLDPRWLPPGGFANLVDLGRSWRCEHFEAFDCVATDDYEQSEDQAGHRLPYTGRFDADLAELASGKHPGRKGDAAKTALIHPGLGLGDLAVAVALFEKARASGIGINLPR